MSRALLLKSVDTLVACKDLGELATNLAQLARRWLDTPEALVLLRSPGAEFTGGQPEAAAPLRAWAEELLRAEPVHGLAHAGGRIAAHIDASSFGVRGVVAVALPGESALDDERSALLGALADLAATCSAQIQRRAEADRALHDTRTLVARGLHDLCTPLNSLRLGMHLLEPALTTKDPAVAQRAHRAVDRMASLVSTMADALGKTSPAGNLRPS